MAPFAEGHRKGEGLIISTKVAISYEPTGAPGSTVRFRLANRHCLGQDERQQSPALRTLARIEANVRFPSFATEAAPFHRGLLIDKLHDDCVTGVSLMGLEPSKTKPRTAEAIRGKVRGVSALGVVFQSAHGAARRHAGHASAVRFDTRRKEGRDR